MPDYSKGKIYVIKNTANDILYVGSTILKLLPQRMGKHRSCAVEGRQSLFYSAMKEIGSEKFSISLLHLFPCTSKDELHAEEQRVIDSYLSQDQKLYNSMVGGKHSEETRAKMSATRLGKPFSEAHKAAIGQAKTGVKFTDEHRNKISAAKRGVATKYGCLGLYTDRGTQKWLFSYSDDGKSRSQTFAVKKYGYWQAKKMAQAARQEVYPSWKPDPEEAAVDELMAMDVE